LRDRLIERWLRTQYEYRKQDVKKVYYLSMEFLIGRLLSNTLINLDSYDGVYDMLRQMGHSLEDIVDEERIWASAMEVWDAWPPVLGFSGHSGLSCLRLRYPLRVWHLQAEHRAGLSGGRA
jgi:hypothetical protein